MQNTTANTTDLNLFMRTFRLSTGAIVNANANQEEGKSLSVWISQLSLGKKKKLRFNSFHCDKNGYDAIEKKT